MSKKQSTFVYRISADNTGKKDDLWLEPVTVKMTLEVRMLVEPLLVNNCEENKGRGI